MIEIWKDIVGYEGLYQISNKGRVKSFHNRCSYKVSEIYKIRALTISENGYFTITLYKNGVRSFRKVHRLVAEAFIPNPLNKYTVNHKDFIKTNNYTSNLEWMTIKENIHHYSKNRINMQMVKNTTGQRQFIL